MIIFESLVTTFEASIIFLEPAGAVAKIGLGLKSNRQMKLVLSECPKRTV